MKSLFTLTFIALTHVIFAMDTLRVESADQFLDALASDHLVLLAPGNYDLSSASVLSAIENSKQENTELTENLFYSSSSGLTVKGVKNMKILGTGNGSNDVVISSSQPENYILTFLGCSNIEISNVRGQHGALENEEYGSGIWFFNQCSRVTVSNNDLRNGKVGVRVSRSKEFTMKNTKISECNSGFVEFIDSWTLRVGNCTFADNIACDHFWYMTGCMDILVENSSFENNVFKVNRNCKSSKLFSITRSEMVFFKNNAIKNNETRYLGNSEAVRLLQSANEIKRNKFKDLAPEN